MVKTAIAAFSMAHRGRISCGDVIRCVFDLSREEWKVYRFILSRGPLRVERVAKFLGKDRSTAYRELQKLINCGICYKEPNNLKEGGYYFLYYSMPLEELKREAEECVERTYRLLKEAIRRGFDMEDLEAEE